MNLIAFLIIFSLFTAAILGLVKKDAIRGVVIKVSSVVIIGGTILFCTQNFFDKNNAFYLKDTKVINLIMLIAELLIMCLIVYLSIHYKKYYVAVLSVAQTALILGLELTHGEQLEKGYRIYCDKLAIIMSVIIAVVGCLICVYAIGYMRDYHNHHKEYKDRRPLFFALLFVFIGAMFGLIFSNNLLWMYFFWEITTLCSFLLIGYTKTKEAINNSFTALWMNLLGGLAFAIAIIYCAIKLGTVDLNAIIQMGISGTVIVLPVLLLSFAALTKSAQLPFSKWLLGAMVAPTPTSALLHSATMVKAGVFLLIRLSPVLHGNLAGAMVILVGGFTFLATSLIAISQSDAKKVLAYSTIANLGLICACAGIGIQESVWAGILLIIFHSVSKSLMFLSVGAVENATGSRNIEDMHGLIVKLPELALVMVIGIAGMFLAPFGMLISKWAALKSFVDSDNIILICFLVFGSAATLFYWTKWLGKLVSVIHNSERLPNTTKLNEWVSMIILSVLMVVLCLTFPIVSKFLIEPFLIDMFGGAIPVIISSGNMDIMTLMLSMIVILPFAIRGLTFGKKNKVVISYMAGVNTGNDREFVDSMGENKQIYLSNWYMENYFGEKILLKPSIAIATVIVTIIMLMVIGGALR